MSAPRPAIQILPLLIPEIPALSMHIIDPLVADNAPFYPHGSVPYVKNSTQNLNTCFHVKVVTVSKQYVGTICAVQTVTFTHSNLQLQMEMSDDPTVPVAFLSASTVLRSGSCK